MTEQELRDWFAGQPAQPQDFVEETVKLTSSQATARQSLERHGVVLTEEEAEQVARRWRREFVEAIPILKAGGALSPDGWRPDLGPLL